MRRSLFVPVMLTLAVVAGAAAFVFAGGPAAPGGGRGAVAPAATMPLTLSKIVPDGRPHTFEMKNRQFVLDGEPTVLMAGEMHFGRVLPEDFEARVKQAKAMGLNALSFYLFWNLSEPEEGKFDFTGVNDVHRMLKICQENGMWAVLRPGPYCCAEVDYGGIPAWTCKYPEVKIRTNDAKYVEWSKRYIDRVGKEVADMQVTRGGPLVMVQMENEFAMVAGASGGYGYMTALHDIFKADFQVPLYACDPGSLVRGANPYGADVLWARNGMGSGTSGAYNAYVAAPGEMPLYSPEVYTAWFAGWGQGMPTQHTSVQEVTTATNFFLDHNVSWCYYMFFGGTNWGFNTGCNEFLPVVTTYDYDAPIDEAGRTTAKFKALRELLGTRTGRELPVAPPEPAVANLGTIKLTEHEALLEALPASDSKAYVKPVSMEMLDQDYGFIDYRKRFPEGVKGTLELRGARDYAITMVNGKTVGKTFIGLGADSNKVTLNEAGPVTLDILVHNLGRVSVITDAASQYRASKGLEGATLDGTELTEWEIVQLPLASVENFKASKTAQTGPMFYRGTIELNLPARREATAPSTFLDMSNFHFGVVWVNGHNLGRFWDRGAARSLFCSGHFLKNGENEITVLELEDAPKVAEIESTTSMVTSAPKPFAMRLDQAGADGRGGARGRGAGGG